MDSEHSLTFTHVLRERMRSESFIVLYLEYLKCGAEEGRRR